MHHGFSRLARLVSVYELRTHGLIGVKRVISALQHGVSRTMDVEFILFDPVQEK